MAIEFYSKSNLGVTEHLGYIEDDELDVLCKVTRELKLACLQFLPYGGDVIFNSEQANHIVKHEIPLLKKHCSITTDLFVVIQNIEKAALKVSHVSHALLIFEGD
jgi:hypothetical protein